MPSIADKVVDGWTLGFSISKLMKTMLPIGLFS